MALSHLQMGDMFPHVGIELNIAQAGAAVFVVGAEQHGGAALPADLLDEVSDQRAADAVSLGVRVDSEGVQFPDLAAVYRKASDPAEELFSRVEVSAAEVIGGQGVVDFTAGCGQVGPGGGGAVCEGRDQDGGSGFDSVRGVEGQILDHRRPEPYKESKLSATRRSSRPAEGSCGV